MKPLPINSAADVPFYLWQPHDIYKRASNIEKARMLDEQIEAVAISMDEQTQDTIRRVAKMAPHMSPGVIQGIAAARQAQIVAASSVEALSNENMQILSDLASLGTADAASAATNATFGATRGNPLPQSPNVPVSPVAGQGPVPAADDDGTSWLDQVNPFSGKSAVANFLTDTLGSPDASDPDPSFNDFLRAAPRITFGNIMSVIFGGGEMTEAVRREYAGEVSKAKELQKRFGLSPDQYKDVFGDDGLLISNLPGAPKVTNDGTQLSFTSQGAAPLGLGLLNAGTDDDTVPVNAATPDSVEKAKAEWEAYRSQVSADGGVWNSATLVQNAKAGSLARTPWFGGEADQKGTTPKVEKYAGKVFDTRTWTERQQAAIRVANERKRVIEETGMDLTAERIAEIDSPRPWTQGRALAGEVVDPETKAYSFLSGVIDFADTLATDPLTYVPGTALTTPAKAGLRAASKAPGVSRVVRPAFEADRIIKIGKQAAKGSIRSALDRTGISAIPKPSGVKWGVAVGDDAAGVPSKVHGVTDPVTGALTYEVRDIPADAPTAFAASGRPQKFATLPEALRFVTKTRLSKVEAGRYVVRDPQDTDTVVEVVRAGREWVGRDANGVDVVTGRTMSDVVDEVAGTWNTAYRMTNDAGDELGTARPRPDGKFDTEEGVFDTLDDARDAYLQRISEARDHVGNAEVADYFRNTDEGRRITAAMLAIESPTEAWLRSGGKVTFEEATRIAQATELDQLVRVLDAGVGVSITDPAALRNYTGIGARAYSTKMKLGGSHNRAMQAVFRSMQKAHNTNAIDLGDADDLAEQSWRLGVELGMPQDALIPHIDDLVGQGDPVLRREYFMDRFLPEVIDTRMQELGVGRGFREKVIAKFRESADDMRKQQRVEFDGQKAVIEGLDDEAAAYYLLHQGQFMYLPSVRDIRRATNKIAVTVRKLQGQREGADTDLIEKLQEHASTFLDTWRNLTLFNSAYILRNIAEESLRASFFGRGSILENPVAYLGLVYQTTAAMDGEVMFKGFSRSMRRLRRLQHTAIAVKYRPETYRGTSLVSVEALRPLVSGNVDDADEMISAFGRASKASSVGKDIGKHGVMDPIVIFYDKDTGAYRIGDGMKRAILALRNGAEEVPIRIQPRTVDPSEGLVLPQAVRDTMTDPTPDHLFGAHNGLDHVVGDTETVMRRAQAEIDRYLGWRRVMKFVNPHYRANAARVTGKSYYQDLRDNSMRGDEDGISAISRQHTMLHGANIIDERPTTAGLRHAKPVTYSPDSTEYAETLADSIGDALRSAEVRDWLQGKRTIDQMIDDILDDSQRTEQVFAAVDVARLAKQNAKQTPGSGPLTATDIERMIDLENTEVRSTLRQLLEGQIDQANLYFGRGTSDALLDVVARGTFENRPLNARNAKFVRFLHDEMGNNDALRGIMPPQLTPVVSPSRERSINLMFNKFFETAGNIRDLITLSPLMREAYADEAARLVGYASDADKAKIVKNLELAGDKTLARRIAETQSAGPEGIVDVEMIENLADRHARQVARDTFYDAAERRNWAVAFRWAAPFAQAAANTTYVWGKAMTTRTPDVYRTIRSLNTVKDFDLSLAPFAYGFEGDGDPALSRDGQMYRDSYGEERFLYPAIGMFANFLPFAERFSATASSNSVNLFQDGLVQTSGPVLQFAVSQVFPDAQARDDIVGTVTRYMNAYPLPSGSLQQRAVQAFTPNKWKNILGDENRKADLVQAVMAAKMQSGELEARFGSPDSWDEAAVRQINEEVKKSVGWVMTLEALGKNLWPTLGAWRYEPLGTVNPEDAERFRDAPIGDVLMSELSREFYKTVGDSSGEDYRNNVAAFQQMYGKYGHLDTLSTRDTNDMPQGVGEVTDFAYEHRDLYDTYHGVVGYLFPKGDYEAEWKDKDAFLRARNERKGYTKRRDATEQLDFVKQEILKAAYKKQSDDLDAVGATAAQKQRLKEAMLAAGYDNGFTDFDAQQIARVESMMTGKDAQRLVSTVPSAQSVATYLQMRRVVRNRLEAQFDSISLASQQALEAGAGVDGLYAAGMALAARDPGFRNFWTLAEREFEDNGDRILEAM